MAVASEPPRPLGPSSRYLAMVESYAAGKAADALVELGSWSERDLRREVALVRDLAEQARHCDACEARLAFERFPLRAAIMLHTERDVLESTPTAASEEFLPRCGVRLHDVLAEQLLEPLLTQPEGRAFARRWYLAMTWRTHWDLCHTDAARLVRAGLKWFPKAAELLVARGTAEEVATLRRVRLPRINSAINPQQRRQIQTQAMEGRQLLEAAQRSFEAALALDSESLEARVRLGHVLWRLEKKDEARACLEAEPQRAGEKDLLCLKSLFLGRIYEEAGRLEDARDQYRAALDAVPTSQAAAVALSETLQLLGDAAGAREVLDRSVGYADWRSPDPYWSYASGHYRRVDDLLEELRLEAFR